MSAPAEIDAALLRNLPLPRLGGDSDKDARGRMLVVAGGGEVPGAAVLTGVAALRVGAGKLQMAATAAYATPLAFAVPEARVVSVAALPNGDIAASAADELAPALRRTDAVVVGPGMMDELCAGELASRLMAAASGAGFVLDAAAMVGLGPVSAAARGLGGRLILTPHAGEMAALTGKPKDEVRADPLGAARGLAGSLQAVVVMKGADSFVVSPDGRAWVHRQGVVGLGTSGSGDVLAGVIGGLLARGAPPATAAVWGVFLHGRAGARLSGRVGPLGFLARELLGELPGALAEMEGPDASFR